MWLTVGLADTFGTDYDPWIRYDFGLTTYVDAMKVWNYNESYYCNSGIKKMEVLYSSDGDNWDSFGQVTLDEAPFSTSVPFGQLIALGVTARYIQFDIIEDYCGNLYPAPPVPLQDNWAVGLSEVRFIPEPATFLLLATGGLFVRKRRKS